MSSMTRCEVSQGDVLACPSAEATANSGGSGATGASAQSPVLEACDLSYAYRVGGKRGRTVFEHAGFSVHAGEILTILGPNGAGKSTLLNCVANLLTPLSGEVLLQGTPIRELGLRKAAQLMGYVPQTHTPAYSYTVLQFVVMGRAPHLGLTSKPARADYDLACSVLEDMGIGKLAHKPYTQISGGERQQATIARAIVQQPKVIMFDEPTNHLDYGNQLRVVSMIRRLAGQGFAVVLTSHMPDHAILIGGTVGILDRDGAFAVGPAKEILEEERLSNLYQTEVHIIYSEELGRNVCVAGRRMHGGGEGFSLEC